MEPGSFCRRSKGIRWVDTAKQEQPDLFGADLCLKFGRSLVAILGILK